MYLCRQFLVATALLSFAVESSAEIQSSVPIAGNAFRSPPSRAMDRDGNLHLDGSSDVDSVFFHVAQPGEVSLAVKASADGGQAKLKATIGETVLPATIAGDSMAVYPLGKATATSAGYLRVDLVGVDLPADASIKVRELIVTSQDDQQSFDYVKSNEGNMFYWGRRGPSVHLAYQLPADRKLTYAYSEMTVPEGQDPIGSYFMANGFGEGYFGIQVNSPTERRVLFSVWSPYRTDNPADIPDADRVVTLAKGDGVHAQDFGNEGSGGQSYLLYPWKSGTTYRFLTEVKPDGMGNTQYTSWFSEKQSGPWLLVASFRRPKTNKHLTGFHSFLENFSPDFGHVQRSANYANQWVRGTDGRWQEITQAKFTGDATARGRHRLDFAGGNRGDAFFLKNCGFFDDQVDVDQVFVRSSTADQRPDVDFDALPRG
ncbi:hypothetical protein K227x_32150 [Rubripirellula lacrimiformis]|uniref:DUF5077 domain-containing protein n=1 Tax=Rubripirellula lacrimiformis TaxID=1930273 RepID=A0A517NCN8_9BACT|nr:DUF3472 domain-containing protein [Rubripirellula lacrimiformis]QDT04818.1 hypothetical protein K227x_32150 [Rubripirellula lacrimiformis]